MAYLFRIFRVPPTPLTLAYVTALPYFGHQTTKFWRHSTSLILNLTSTQKGVYATQDGVKSRTNNLVFSSLTGEPVITSITDGFDRVSILSSPEVHNGKYINYAIPAAMVYPHLGQKSENERFVLKLGEQLNAPIQLVADCLGDRPSWLGDHATCQLGATFINLQSEDFILQGKGAENFRSGKRTDGDPTISGNSREAFTAAIDNGKLVEGDLIELKGDDDDKNPIKVLYYINEIDLYNRHRIYLNPVSFTANKAESDKNPEFTELTVISSGYSNQLVATAASVSTYGEELVNQVFDKEADVINGLDALGNPTGSTSMNNYGAKVSMGNEFKNVVASSAVKYSDDWYNYQLTKDYDEVEYNCLKSNTFETGARGKWRPKETYVYKEDLVSNERITDAGYFSQLIPFVFRDKGSEVHKKVDNLDYLSSHEASSTGEMVNNPKQNDKWVKTNRVTMYSPNGEALEEENILGVRSAAKFGYGENVPVLVAANAPYQSILFEGFDNRTEDFITEEKAHSGTKAVKLMKDQSIQFGTIEAVPNVKDDNHMTLKFWVNSQTNVADLDIEFKKLLIEDDLTSHIFNIPTSSFEEVAIVGEWKLVKVEGITLEVADNYRAANELNSRGPGREYIVTIKNIGGAPIYLDDVRMQPAESQMTTYVYDPENLRLLATFDDQHFGLFYQYNAEGKLVRKLIETERGIKTVTETQYHTPFKDRGE